MTSISTPTQAVMPRGPSMRLAWGLAAVSTIAGVAGLIWRFTGGHVAANYGSYVPWGLWIATYVALIGASAGAFGFAAFVFTQRRIEHYRVAVLATLVSFGAFTAGLLNVWLDLGHPMRAWKLLTDTSISSVMGIMAWFYLVYGLILLVGLVGMRKGGVPTLVERFSWVAILFAFVFAGAEGSLFGVVGAQPLWESGLTPILFLAEAALFGLGLVAVAAAVFGLLESSSARMLGTGMLIAAGLVVGIEWAEFSTGLFAGVPAKAEALRTIIWGPYWWVFWLLHLGLGLIVPALILLRRRGDVMATGLAGGLVAGMAIASKLNLIIPAIAQEDIAGLSESFSGPGLGTTYFPSPMEWLVWLGTLGLAGLIVLGGHRWMSAHFTETSPTSLQETK